MRDDLKRLGVLSGGEMLTTYEPLSWTRAEKRRAENYEVGMVVTFNRSGAGFRAGDLGRVARVENGHVRIDTKGVERMLPLWSGIFDVAKTNALEVCAGERLLVRANYRREGLLNGDFVTVHAVHSSILLQGDEELSQLLLKHKAVLQRTVALTILGHRIFM